MRFKIDQEIFQETLVFDDIIKMGFDQANIPVMAAKGFTSFLDGKGLIIHYSPEWIDKDYSTNIAIQKDGVTMCQLPCLTREDLYNKIRTIRMFGKKKELIDEMEKEA